MAKKLAEFGVVFLIVIAMFTSAEYVFARVCLCHVSLVEPHYTFF